MTDTMRLVIRTPHETVVDEPVLGARVPTASGHVGLRPRQEPFLAVVASGLVVLTSAAGVRFAATAGGLLRTDRGSAVLATPFAVRGESGAEVLAALDAAYATPDSELAARRQLAELEQRIVHELRPKPGGLPDAG